MDQGLRSVHRVKMIRVPGSHLELCHYRNIRAQYSSSNARYLNFNNGNVNNNSKTNTNIRARAVSDCQILSSVEFQAFLTGILAAYYECRRKKRSSKSEIYYEMDGTRYTVHLALDIYKYEYVIGPSSCFIVFEPTIREVFCARFRDRIVHSWIAMRLGPMFERYLPDAINANRVGRGTAGAIRQCASFIEKGGWIYKFDIQGFFMSIDKRLLWKKLKPFADGYAGWDREWFMYALELSLFNAPQFNCIMACSPKNWDPLPKSKSLFGNDRWHGLPIGDLLSQMLVGFFISSFILYIQSLGLDVTNYVDDFVIRSDRKEKILEAIPKLRAFLRTLGLTLHPRKSYIQHSTKGVAFLGAIIKTHRLYCGHRTLRNAFRKRIPKNLTKAMQTVNSYLGYMKHYCTFNKRKALADKCFRLFGDKIAFGKSYSKLIIRKPKQPVIHRRKIRRKHTPHGLQVYYLKDM